MFRHKSNKVKNFSCKVCIAQDQKKWRNKSMKKTNENPSSTKEDIHSTKSKRTGFAGLLETFVRNFKTLGFILVLIPAFIALIIPMGLALTPSLALFQTVLQATESISLLARSLALGTALATGYFLYGLCLIFIVPLLNLPLIPFVRRQRSTWYSLSVIPWYYHNGLTYLVRYTFLEFITPSPLNILFYKMMGMKIGKGTMINTTNISDPCLIELGNFVTIGGSATLMAHYGMKGFLIVDKLVIEDFATIGLKASLFGNVVVKKGAIVAPHEVVLPKTIKEATKAS